MAQKFAMNAAASLDRDRAEQVSASTLALAEAKDITSLMALVRG